MHTFCILHRYMFNLPEGFMSELFRNTLSGVDRKMPNVIALCSVFFPVYTFFAKQLHNDSCKKQTRPAAPQT